MDFETLRVIHTLLCGEVSLRRNEFRKEEREFKEWRKGNPNKQDNQAPNYRLMEMLREQWEDAKHASEQFHSVLWSGTGER